MPNVVYFNNTMSGAPSLNNAVNTGIAVLDACLVDGFGSVTVNSLVVASDVATATVSGGHQFEMIGNTGPVIRISGANPPALNGDWRVTVTSATVFTFATTGITDQTATGTISAKRAPAGFSKAFSGTNKAAYRSDDVAGNRLYLRIDDSSGSAARLRGFEAMSDVDTGTGPFPTDAQLSGGGYWYKANSATSREWHLISDGFMVYFLCDAASGWANSMGGFIFGEIARYQAPDAYSTVLIASASASNSPYCYAINNTFGSWFARSYTQLSGSVTCTRQTHTITPQYLGYASSGSQIFPAPADRSLHLWPVEAWEPNVARGRLPGLWNPIHTGSPSHLFIVTNVPDFPGRTFLCLYGWGPSYRVVFDITGPWRS